MKEERAMAAAQSAVNSGNSAVERTVVTFRLDQQSYALPVETVEEIVLMVTITPVPQVSGVVEGMVNVHGAAVPVVNLRRHLGLAPAALQLYTPILLVRLGEWTVGLIVDEVIDVLHLPTSRIARPADVLPEELGQARVLQGLACGEGGMVMLLDLGHLFLPDQAEALAQVAGALPETLVEQALGEPSAEVQAKPARRRRKKEPAKEAPQKASVEARPKPAGRRRKKAAAEEAPEDVSAKTQPKPTRKRRKKEPAKGAPQKVPVEARPKPAARRRRKAAAEEAEAASAKTQPKATRKRRKKPTAKDT